MAMLLSDCYELKVVTMILCYIFIHSLILSIITEYWFVSDIFTLGLLFVFLKQDFESFLYDIRPQTSLLLSPS